MSSSHKKRHLITAALPYANGPLHIGHIAGVYLPADIYVRYLRNQNENVAFICGSDEHGAAITLKAKKENTTPKEIVDKFHQINKQAFNDFGITLDIYHRTSAEIHHQTASDMFLHMEQKQAFTQSTTEQYYDETHQQFLADRYITGTCPNCKNTNAYGDQCEKCGSTLSPTELIDPKSTLSGARPILKETSHWFLPMDKHEDWLREWIETGNKDGKHLHNTSKWRKQVIGQCKSWIDNGLLPRAITRDLDWGVKVPLKDADGKVLYVWFDAPIGYVSATKEWAKENGKNWEDYWKSEDTSLIHFLGKDNIVFHAIIFPIILSQQEGFNLPENVVASEFLNLEGDKLSTSRNWAVWLHEYLEDFPNKQDELRYVLTSIAPETKDSEFTWKDFQNRVNNELVAILGNFFNRTIVLTHKYFEGKKPSFTVSDSYKYLYTEIADIKKNVSQLIREFKFRDAQFEAMKLARLGNKFLADTEPWKLIKTDEEAVKEILGISLEICYTIQEVMDPFLPYTCDKIRALLQINHLTDIFEPGHQLAKPSLLFEKIDEEIITQQMEKLQASTPVTAMPQKETITFDQFQEMDMRAATILSAEKHPNADKLLVMKVDTGIDTRTVVSGIAEHYKPESVIGQQVTILTNLSPRKIRGIESQGMILMAENADKKLVFIQPATSIDNGATIQ